MTDARSRVRWFVSRPSDTSHPLPTVAHCALLIAGVKLSLAVVGFGRTRRWILRRTASTPLIAAAVPDVEAFEYTVAMAAALYPGRAACLQRSLVLYYLARRVGIPVTYHHGVQPLPLKAHAWVEYGGRVVNDVPESVSTFLPFPPIMP